MTGAKALSRRSRLALSAAALALLLGSGISYAESQHLYTSSYEFQVIDASQPVIVTWVNGSFTDQPISVHVDMSSQDGVGHLSGTFSVTVQVWNDSAGAFVNFRDLAAGQAITLTPTPVTLSYAFTTGTPGDYNIYVEFNATSATSG